MYTDPMQAVTELRARRKDQGLIKAVTDYLGWLPEGWPEDRPIATINRYVATARVEDVVFAHAASSLALRPYWPTYHAEKYTSMNPEKVSCLRPRVQRPRLQFSKNWLVEGHEKLEGIPLGEIAVGEVSLQDVHTAARRQALPEEVAGNTFDISEWNQAQARRFGATEDSRRLAPHYYHGVMALYICHGVLFEDFDGGLNASSGLGTFVQEVVNPAIRSVSRLFGLAPLIVRLPYTVGYIDYPASCGPVFDELTVGRKKK